MKTPIRVHVQQLRQFSEETQSNWEWSSDLRYWIDTIRDGSRTLAVTCNDKGEVSNFTISCIKVCEGDVLDLRTINSAIAYNKNER